MGGAEGELQKRNSIQSTKPRGALTCSRPDLSVESMAQKSKAKKKRVAAKRTKNISQQIDEFDWRNAKKVRVGDAIVAKKKTNRKK
jgi:hypothetical protein